MNWAKVIAILALLAWFCGLQVFIYRNVWYITWIIPYLLLIQKGKKKTAHKSMNVGMHDSTMIGKKDVSTWTEDIDCATNETIELLNDNVCDTNPFVNMTENPFSDGNIFMLNPFIGGTEFQLHPSENPFLEIDENDRTHIHNTREECAPFLSTNPFLEECLDEQIVDISIFFPNGIEGLFSDMSFVPTESDMYCQEWINKHRNYFIKSVRSFSTY